MTQEEFIKVLKGKGYYYYIEGDKIIVNDAASVDLDSLTSLPPGVVFKNGWHVYLRYLTSLPSDVEFRNGGDVSLDYLLGGNFTKWKGNIKGIDSKRLLNSMVSKGLFER